MSEALRNRISRLEEHHLPSSTCGTCLSGDPIYADVCQFFGTPLPDFCPECARPRAKMTIEQARECLRAYDEECVRGRVFPPLESPDDLKKLMEELRALCEARRAQILRGEHS